jgi:TldD protein
VSLTGPTDEREVSSVRLHVHVRVESEARAFVAKRSLRHSSLGVTPAVRGLVEEARDAASTFIDARPVPRGITDVVLANGSSGIFLHEVLGHCLEGDVLLTGQSVFSRKLGERIATRGWTVIDEPLDQAAVLDDEGQRMQPVVMVEEGRLRASLLDRLTALRFGLASSHNGRLSSFREAPLPRMRRTTLLPGALHPEEIIRGVKRGVYIERLGAAGVVLGTGDFTLVVSEAHLIEDGRLTAPLSELTVVGNGPRQLLEANVVGTDTTATAGVWSCVKGGQSVDVAFGGPTLRLSSVVVRGGA